MYNANVVFGSYVAVGYGYSMTNTDMCFWSANGATSIQEDLYSTGHSKPAVDLNNAYTTTMSVTATGTSFISSRPIAATGNDTYIIPIGQQF